MKKSPTLREKLAALIASHSVSSVSEAFDSSNKAVIDLLADWFSALGFSIDIQTVAPGKFNLIARLGEGTGGLVLAGHSDTVPFNESHWSSNPLKLEERDGRFYGLGTCDMKSFFALITEALEPLLDKPFSAPLIVLATCDEESSMSGARALAQSPFINAKACIIGEPTELTPIYMHKGIMMQKLAIKGQSGHSSNPALGKNALEAMTDALLEIRQFRNEIQQRYQMPEFSVAFPTMNFGCIHGGDNPNRICSSCEMHFDFRALPGMDTQSLLGDLDQRLQQVASAHNVEFTRSNLMQEVASFAEDKHSELVRLAENLTKKDAKAVAFATEAPFLKNMGLETIVMGPGSIDQAHQGDEFISYQQTQLCIDILQQTIQHYCLSQS